MTTNTTSPHPDTEREFSKLDRYALAPYMTTDQVGKTSDEVIGVLAIDYNEDEGEPTQAEIEALIEEEVDRYLVYRYIEFIFLSRYINITMIS